VTITTSAERPHWAGTCERNASESTSGRRLHEISCSVSVESGYSYAFVEKVMGISSDRSNARLEADYLMKRKLLVRGRVLWQRTHGGLRFGYLAPADLVELLFRHHRLLRDNYWHAGGALVYSSVSWFRSDYAAFAENGRRPRPPRLPE
jgi:hypothetical protein